MQLGDEDDQEPQEPVSDRRITGRKKRPREPVSPSSNHSSNHNNNNNNGSDTEPEDPYEEKHHPRGSLLREFEQGDNILFPSEGERKKVWKSFIPDSFNEQNLDLLEKEHITDPNWSFLEWYSESTLRSEDDAHISNLIRFVNENWDKTSRDTLLLNVQSYYNRKIRPNHEAIKDKQWSLKQIYHYFNDINPSPFIIIEEQIRTMCQAAQTIRKHELWEYEEIDKDIRINKEALAKYMTVTKRLDYLIKEASTLRSRHQV